VYNGDVTALAPQESAKHHGGIVESITDMTTPLADAIPLFKAFLEDDQQARQVLVHDVDADGSAAGALLEVALLRLGHRHVVRFLPDRSRNVWSSEVRARLAELHPERLFILDLGVRSEPVLPGIPTCYIDHHAIDGPLPHGTVISSYHWRPIPNTSVLVWQLCRALTDITDRNWLAVVGAISDMCEQDFPELLSMVKADYPLSVLRDVVSLVNAGRRISSDLARLAGDLLVTHADPSILLQSAGADRLREARRTVNHALMDAKRAAPIFAGRVALLRIRSPYQLHPLIAQIWRTRLPHYIVISANEAYLPGRVNFSVRGPENVNLREFLKSVPFDPGGEEYARGHDAACGGSLPIGTWNQFLTALGFPSTVLMHDSGGIAS
jgi:hypothetical protein